MAHRTEIVGNRKIGNNDPLKQNKQRRYTLSREKDYKGRTGERFLKFPCPSRLLCFKNLSTLLIRRRRATTTMAIDIDDGGGGGGGTHLGPTVDTRTNHK